MASYVVHSGGPDFFYEKEAFESAETVDAHLFDRATDAYAATVMTWVKSASVGEKFPISNGSKLDLWERTS